MRTLAVAMLALVVTPALAQTAGKSSPAGDSTSWRWDHWDSDRGGTRFSPLAQITPANVDNLVRAWEFHTGDLQNRPSAAMARTKFEATPLFVENSLIFCSPFNEVIVLDPGTGQQRWRYDPNVSNSLRPDNRYVCISVTTWGLAMRAWRTSRDDTSEAAMRRELRGRPVIAQPR